MIQPRPLVAGLALLLLGAAMAGCSGKGGNGDGSAGDGPGSPSALTDEQARAATDALNLKATPTTGIIRGVVVDQAVHPLEKARVTLTLPGQGTLQFNTTKQGAFGFQGLKPGIYAVEARKAGYSPAQSSIDVQAGVDNPRLAKLQLVADPTNAPYVVPYTFPGYIECSFQGEVPGVVGAGYAACSAAQNECVPVADTCTGNLTNDNFGVFYTLDKVPTYVQSEMVWESTQAATEAMSLLHSWSCDSNGGFPCDFSATGASPLVLASDAPEIAQAGWGSNGTQLFVRVFSGTGDPTGTGLGAGATIEQAFTVYTHVFYGYKPPAGWTFGADGVPAAPV